MGGRGGSSGLGSLGMADRFRQAGTQFVETDRLDMGAVNEALRGVSDVLKDMGLPLDTVATVAGRFKMGKGDAALGVNGFNQLSFSNKIFSSMENARKASASDQFVTSSIYGSGAHEAGHLVMNEVIKKAMKGSSNLDRANARSSGKIEKQILREAQKKYGSNPRISKYGSTNPAEKVAEAVADVYTNKSRANPYSKVIVDIVKQRLRG